MHLHCLLRQNQSPKTEILFFIIISFDTSITIFCLQIKHMMAFIEQEANEKAEEIDAKVRTEDF